jgi:hypothetical protein
MPWGFVWGSAPSFYYSEAAADVGSFWTRDIVPRFSYVAKFKTAEERKSDNQFLKLCSPVGKNPYKIFLLWQKKV